MAARLVRALLLAAVASACTSAPVATAPSSTDTTTPSPSPTASPSPSGAAPAGWTDTVRTSNAGTVHVALPPTWRAIDLSADAIANSYGTVAAQNPDFAKAFTLEQMRSLAATGIFMYAFDFDPSSMASGLMTNMNVLAVTATQGLTVDTFAQVTNAQLEVALKAKVTSSTKMRIAGSDAARTVYEYTLTKGTTSIPITGVQYAVILGGYLHAITFTALHERFDSYGDTFDKISQSYRVG